MQTIFSTAIDGKIKAWLYDLAGSRVEFNALASGELQWLTLLMEQGKMLNLEWCLVCEVSSWGSEFYFNFFICTMSRQCPF